MVNTPTRTPTPVTPVPISLKVEVTKSDFKYLRESSDIKKFINRYGMAVLNPITIEFSVNKPKADYRIQVTVPRSTGIDIGSGEDSACDYHSTRQTPTTKTLDAGINKGSARLYLTRCRLGSGQDSITIKSYLHGNEVTNNYSTIEIPQAPHVHHELGVLYRVCGNMPPTPIDLDYKNAIGKGAGEWNAVKTETGGFRIHELANERGCEDVNDKPKTTPRSWVTNLTSVAVWDGNGGECSSIASACLRYSPKNGHLSDQTMYFRFPLKYDRIWSNDVNMTSDTLLYLPSTIAHEFGHAGGLAHTSVSGHLMQTPRSPMEVNTAYKPDPHAKDAMESLYQPHTR